MQRTLTPALLLLFCLAAPGLYAQKPAVQRASIAVPVRNVSAQKSDIEQIDTSLLPPSVRFIPEDYITLPGSFKKGSGSPIDTLDIGDSYLQIVLNDDNTWHYIKNIDKLSQEEVFRSFWSETEVNPYDKVNLSDLGYRNIICLVDSVSTFTCPYQGRVYSKFGYRRGRRHQGLDVPYKVGTPVSCAFDGCVRLSRYVKGYGNLVIVRHENGLETFYAHLSRRDVQPGDWLRSGDIVGLGGSTGRSSGPHLHFETRYKGYAFDPEWIVDFENGLLRTNVFVLRRSYLDPSSRYVPESIDEEEDIYSNDEKIIEEEMRIAAEKAAMKWHTVRSGDTVSGIAHKYGKSLSTIKKLNPGINLDKIRIGQKIRVN
ncbi:MAG: M23 family metallopeptidase [Bacteroidales bacterium]|nr:M23 family metallopeptidase [Bacteroidales bacterium]